MADDALQQLERLRAEAVDSARRALVRARQELAARDVALRVATSEARTCESALRCAREGFATATTVATLRVAEQHARSCATDVGAAALRVRQAAQRRQLAQGQVDARVSALRAAELARRVVSRSVEARVADVSLRTERREEDERDDQLRART